MPAEGDHPSAQHGHQGTDIYGERQAPLVMYLLQVSTQRTIWILYLFRHLQRGNVLIHVRQNLLKATRHRIPIRNTVYFDVTNATLFLIQMRQN